MKIFFRTVTITVTLLLLTAAFTTAGTEPGLYQINGPDSVVGTTLIYKSRQNESLIEIARKFGLGYNEIADANPALDPFVPGTGSLVRLPISRVVPYMKSYKGIVINLSEMRLYNFFTGDGKTMMRSFPIGIGMQGFSTPTGRYRVVRKIKNPAWHVPASIRKEDPTLPRVVPAGPDNPLGTHALRLSAQNLLIHGTNRPFAVGRQGSHGCLRLYPEDISELFEMVPRWTDVTIVRQPVKAGARNGRIYLEVHKDDSLKIDYREEALRLLKSRGLFKDIVPEKLNRALAVKSGVAVIISK